MKHYLSKLDFRLIFSLFFIQLVPTLYTTLRVFFLGQLPGDYAFSIAGQLGWVNLIYEVINEAIILPLFYFVGKTVDNRKEMNEFFKSSFLFVFCVYSLLAVVIAVFIKPLLVLMAVNKDILSESALYIRLETVATIFSMLVSFVLVFITTVNNVKCIYSLTIIRLILCLLSDIVFVSNLSCSLKLGVYGIAVSNIIVNVIILAVALMLLKRIGIHVISDVELSFSWLRELFKVGGISGIESFVRNFAYIIMVSRMVNVVNEQGTYWVANNFIWGWLLLPITQLGEYIKKDVATDKKAIKTKTAGYFLLTAIICLCWFLTMPFWKVFMEKILMFDDVNKLYELVVILVGFYVMYAFQNVFDATFYGTGKTSYMLFESVITNVIYYGTAYILYVKGIWVPTLNGIAVLFGFGIAFDSLVSLYAYLYFLKKNRKKIPVIT